MKKRIVSTVLLTSTIATNLVAGNETIVLAGHNDNSIDELAIEAINGNENIEQNQKSHTTIDENIVKPEISYNDDNYIRKSQDIKDELAISRQTVIDTTGDNVTKSDAKEDIFAVKHSIMGKAEVTKSAFKQFFKQRANKFGYEYKLNCTIDEFVDFAYEEASIEGVRADIVLAQAAWETGYFQYGGIVDPNDNNYAGIGATGEAGIKEKFESPRVGLRAQIQHLKAYASKDSLVQACVDPRFKYVNRGCAPSVEELAGKWAVPGYNTNQYSSLEEAAAANDSYGQIIYGIVEKAMEYNGITDNNVEIEKPVVPTPDENEKPSIPPINEEQKPILINKGKVINVKANSSLNVRSESNRSSAVIYQLKVDQNVNIYGEENCWYKIDYVEKNTTKYGYVSKDYISIINDTTPPSNNNGDVVEKPEIKPEVKPETKPEITPPQQNTTTPETTKKGEINVKSVPLNIRSGAGTQYSVITTLPKGTEVKILGEVGEWYKIKFNGREGYGSKAYIKVIANDTTTVKPPITNQPSQTYSNGITLNVSLNLNVRKEPNANSQVVGYLLPKTSVKVISKSGSWYKIIFNTSVGEKEGYVSAQYIKIN